jgi:DNA-binding NtrC family response regulator
MQAKLLRVLEEGEVERIGGDKPVTVDVRVIVATHRNLDELVKQGKFRQDLFHRVYVFPLVLPPLRERSEDIPRLIEHFAQQVGRQNNWKAISFTADAIRALQTHAWPGNVRELRNVVERLMLLADSDKVTLDLVSSTLPPSSVQSAATSATGTLSERVQQFERETMLSELKRNNFHITNTAKSLGLERSHFYKKAEQLGIDIQRERHGEDDSVGS